MKALYVMMMMMMMMSVLLVAQALGQRMFDVTLEAAEAATGSLRVFVSTEPAPPGAGLRSLIQDTQV